MFVGTVIIDNSDSKVISGRSRGRCVRVGSKHGIKRKRIRNGLCLRRSYRHGAHVPCRKLKGASRGRVEIGRRGRVRRRRRRRRSRVACWKFLLSIDYLIGP